MFSTGPENELLNRLKYLFKRNFEENKKQFETFPYCW